MKALKMFALMAAVCALPLVAGVHSGRRAPGFALPDGTMKYHDLADFRGKVVLIDFMKTSCPHCVTLAKTLERVTKKYGSQVVVLSVVLPPDTTRTVQTFLKANQVNMMVLFDCGQMTASYVQPSPQNPSVDFPFLFVVDTKGVIYDAYQPGDQTKSIFEGDGLVPILDRLLAGGTRADNQSGTGENTVAATAAPAMDAVTLPVCRQTLDVRGE